MLPFALHQVRNVLSFGSENRQRYNAGFFWFNVAELDCKRCRHFEGVGSEASISSEITRRKSISAHDLANFAAVRFPTRTLFRQCVGTDDVLDRQTLFTCLSERSRRHEESKDSQSNFHVVPPPSFHPRTVATSGNRYKNVLAEAS